MLSPRSQPTEAGNTPVDPHLEKPSPCLVRGKARHRCWSEHSPRRSHARLACRSSDPVQGQCSQASAHRGFLARRPKPSRGSASEHRVAPACQGAWASGRSSGARGASPPGQENLGPPGRAGHLGPPRWSWPTGARRGASPGATGTSACRGADRLVHQGKCDLGPPGHGELGPVVELDTSAQVPFSAISFISFYPLAIFSIRFH